jgi:glycosyltransferase involved in cell wall biosynthesis
MTDRRLGEDGPSARTVDGVRVVLDVRPLQEPDRAPTTAIYLEQLLRAFVAEPLAGESFTVLTQAGLPDPTEALDVLRGLPVAGRRPLPPTRLLRAGALTTDPFVLRSASIGAGRGAGRGADRSGAAGAVFHTASGAVPIASGLPVVVTLLDLAPWEIPHVYQRSPAARFGHRLRARILRDAAVVIVPSRAAALDARRLLRIRRDRLRVVELAARAEFAPSAAAEAAAERDRLGLPARYLVYPGRFDARQDLPTLLHALADLTAAGRPAGLDPDVPWPPRLVLVDATPDDRAAVARAAARYGVGELVAHAARLGPDRLAALVAGARAAVLPAISATAGLPAVEALAAGCPVVASGVGSLPEIVGAGGLIVEPRDPVRLATALATIWRDDSLHASLVEAIASRPAGRRRTWADVARETRAIYADAAARS